MLWQSARKFRVDTGKYYEEASVLEFSIGENQVHADAVRQSGAAPTGGPPVVRCMKLIVVNAPIQEPAAAKAT